MKNNYNSLKNTVGLLLILVISVGCKTTDPSASSTYDASASCSQQVSQQSCGFYDCFETLHPCGTDGYTKAYGRPYCDKFQGMCEGTLTSDRARKWVSGTTKCLQQELANMITSSFSTVSCDEIHRKGFGSHTRCYTTGAVQHGGASFCTLSSGEWYKIRNCISASDRYSREGLQQILATGARCTPLLGRLFSLQDTTDGQADVDQDTLKYLQKLPPEELAERAAALTKLLQEISDQLDAP